MGRGWPGGMAGREGREGSTRSGILLPSLTMGEYEAPLAKVRKPRGLMPMEDMLDYGPLPLPGGYQRRQKKPKVYAAYGGKRSAVIKPERSF